MPLVQLVTIDRAMAEVSLGNIDVALFQEIQVILESIMWKTKPILLRHDPDVGQP